jgi:hypothetical protein
MLRVHVSLPGGCEEIAGGKKSRRLLFIEILPTAIGAPRRQRFRADSGPLQNSGRTGQVGANFGYTRVYRTAEYVSARFYYSVLNAVGACQSIGWW